MDRLRELLFKVRNRAPDMPDYDRNGRRISPARSELLSPLGGLRALILERVAVAPDGLTNLQIAERLERRLDKIDPQLPALLEFGLLLEVSGVYRPPADLLERLELDLERSGCNAAQRRDRERYESDREARRLFVRQRLRQRQPEPGGYIEDLERVEDSETTGPTPEPTPGGEIVQAPGKSVPDAGASLNKADAWITDSNDLEQFRELAHVLRTGMTRAEAQREMRSARREARRLDRERGGYESRHDGVSVSPAAFLRTELRGVSGMDYEAMLRRWRAMGGREETLEGAIFAGPYRFKKEPMDFYRWHVLPAAVRTERGAA